MLVAVGEEELSDHRPDGVGSGVAVVDNSPDLAGDGGEEQVDDTQVDLCPHVVGEKLPGIDDAIDMILDVTGHE